MDDLSDIKNIWLSADKKYVPKTSELVKAIRRYVFGQIVKRTTLVLISLVLAALMVYTVFFYKSSLVVTRIGEAFIFIAIFILIGAHARSLSRASRLKSFTNNDFINYLKTSQLKQFDVQKSTQATGFALSSIGLLLYVFEGVHKDRLLMVVTYLLVIIWILVSWFVVRPLARKRKIKNLKQTIEKLEMLSEQLSNN